ncbi:MAG: D-aminoacyl-tRNA deacylase [Synergistota bacterium]|nr:D-aminoacyl-tRNA deacylase [Synergistota bacterium]
MRAVVQRVSRASVSVDGTVAGEIGPGLCVLVGVTHDDGVDEAAWMAEKITSLRIFEDEEGKMNLSLRDTGGALLAVSQFTLYGDCRKGRRPSFVRAAAPEPAKELYEVFVEKIRGLGVETATGVFQAFMKVDLCNDGPVTLIVDTGEKAQ